MPAALQATAMEYLAAIAEGRASDASALVPPTLRGQLAPDEVLAAARPIRDYSAAVGHLDGATGTVVVEYTDSHRDRVVEGGKLGVEPIIEVLAEAAAESTALAVRGRTTVPERAGPPAPPRRDGGRGRAVERSSTRLEELLDHAPRDVS